MREKVPLRKLAEQRSEPGATAADKRASVGGRFHPQQPHSRLGSTVLGLSPDMVLVIIVAYIVLAEAARVVLHFLLPELTLGQEVVLETLILLTLLLIPYYFMYRPFWLERQQAEKEIRLLSRQLIRTEEKIRKNLARDLHDEFGQVLTALQFGVETICNSLPPEQKHLGAHCDRLSGMIAGLGNHVRDVTAELRPTMLDNIGLLPALRWHARQFEAMHPGIGIEVQVGEEPRRLPPELEIALYRICQESLNNVAKHARARQVRIELRWTPALLTFSVRDDGIGFDFEHWRDAGSAPRGFGILGMRERIADLGGLFEVASRPGKGTEVRVELPLAEGVKV